MKCYSCEDQTEGGLYCKQHERLDNQRILIELLKETQIAITYALDLEDYESLEELQNELRILKQRLRAI
jgi:hypothetical protein